MNINEVKKVLNQRMPQASNLMNALIVKNDESYGLYGLYQIFKEDTVYRAVRLTDEYTRIFGNLRSATAWCILDKRNKVYLANELYDLDMKIAGLFVELQQAYKMRDTAKLLGDYITYDTKYSLLLEQKADMVAKINSIINEANVWQDRQFRVIAK